MLLDKLGYTWYTLFIPISNLARRAKAMTKYISVADTAKLVRTALKASFTTIKFSVKSKSYSGGASITVSWTDGPTAKEVDFVVSKYQGASFDGMIDLKSYHTSDLNGEQVHFGADYIFTSRGFSVAFMQRRAAKIAAKYGAELVIVTENKWGSFDLAGGNGPCWQGSPWSVRDVVMQEAYKTRAAI